ncbi:MAG: hypothetical protein ACTSQ8_08080 [Candidatus Helarchaeota archaeon]
MDKKELILNYLYIYCRLYFLTEDPEYARKYKEYYDRLILEDMKE